MTKCGAWRLGGLSGSGHGPALRCANAYNLNGKGANVVGDLLGDWLVEHVAYRRDADRVVA